MWPFNPYLKKPLTIWRWATWVITHQPNPHDLQAVLATFLFLVPPFRTLRTFGWSSCFSSPTPPFPSPSPIFSCSRTMAAVRPLKPSFLQVPQPPKMKRQLRHPKTWSGKILYRQDLPSPTLSWTGLVRLVFLGFWWELSTSWGPSAATLPRRVLGGTAEASVEPAELDLFFLPFPLDFPPFFAFEPFFLDPFLESFNTFLLLFRPLFNVLRFPLRNSFWRAGVTSTGASTYRADDMIGKQEIRNPTKDWAVATKNANHCT